MNEREALRKAIAANPKQARKMLDLVAKGKIQVGPPDENEELTIVSVRWPGMFDGCIPEPCMACGKDIAVAPSSQEMVARHKGKVQYLCLECMTMPVH